jgi:hypothetical protein
VQYIFGNQLRWITDLLGDPWRFVLSLFGLKRDALLAFIRDCLTFWYNVWSLYRVALVAFLSNPAGFILAAIRKTFLDWLTQLIADNW